MIRAPRPGFESARKRGLRRAGGTAIFAAALSVSPAHAVTPPPATPPAPSPAARPAVLEEIGHVRVTSPFCRSQLERTIGAVYILLGNDVKLTVAEDTLRHVDLDTSVLTKHKGTEELNRQYVALRAAAVDGRGMIKALKHDARDAPTKEQQQALLALGAALDGALERQKNLADELGRLVVYTDNHAPLDKEEHERLEFEAIKARNTMGFPHPDEAPLARVPDPLTAIAKQGATEIEKRAQPLAADEDAAAIKIDAAFSRC